MIGKTKQKDEIRELLDAIPDPTPEQMATLDEHGDPKGWGVEEEMKRITREKYKKPGTAD